MPEFAPRELRVWFNKSFSSLEHPLSTVRAAWREESTLYIFASHTQGGCGAFLHADECFGEPDIIRAEDYADWCLSQCRARRVDLFVPGRRIVEIAARSEDFAALGTRLLVAATTDTLCLLHDKARCHESLFARLPLPDTRLVCSLAAFHEAVRALDEAGHQVCFKPVRGAGGVGFHRLDERATLRRRLLDGWQGVITLADAARALGEGDSFPPLVVMEYLPGVEFSVDALAWRGEVRLTLARRKQGQVQVIGHHPEVEAHLRMLTAHFGLSGLFNAQFRTGADGVLKFLEINPRMSGGLGHTEATGVHLLALALELCLHNGVEIAPLPTPRLPVTVLPCHRAIEVLAGTYDGAPTPKTGPIT